MLSLFSGNAQCLLAGGKGVVSPVTPLSWRRDGLHPDSASGAGVLVYPLHKFISAPQNDRSRVFSFLPFYMIQFYFQYLPEQREINQC